MPEYRVWIRHEPEKFRFIFSQSLRNALDEGADVFGVSRWDVQGERLANKSSSSGCGPLQAACSLVLVIILGALAALAEVL